MDEFKHVCELIKENVPEFEIRYKNKSWSSWVIGALLWIFNRKYMKEFTTTRYPRVYFPSNQYVQENPKRALKILLHEFVHLYDRKEQGLWFTFSYLMPQLFAVGCLLSGLFMLGTLKIFGVGCLAWVLFVMFAIFFLILMCPWPSYWRARHELRGYAMNIAVNYWRYGSIHQKTIDWIVERFIGWDYYRMWPYPERVEEWLDKVVFALEDGTISKDMKIGSQSSYPYRVACQFFDA